MEQKKYVKMRLGTAICLVVIFILIVCCLIFGVYYNVNNNKENESLNNNMNGSEENNLVINENKNKEDEVEVDSTKINNKYSEKEIEDVIQMCLKLEEAKSNGLQDVLYILGLYKEGNSYFESEKSAKKIGFIKTTIKYVNFKEEMHKYMTEECYKNQWEEYLENEDGYLCYANVGATGFNYKVDTIEKTEDGYIANVIISSEAPDSKMPVNFIIDENKCIVKSYDF